MDLMAGFSDPCSKHMSSPVFSVPPKAPLAAVRDRFLELGITSLAVIDPVTSELLGVVTRSDLYRAGKVQRRAGIDNLVLPDEEVASVMTFEPLCVSSDDTVAAASRQMIEKKVHRVFVRRGQGIVGVLSTRDVMRVVAAARISIPLHEIMSSPVHTIRFDQSIGDAVRVLDRVRVSSLVVLDRGWPCGVLSHEELIAAGQLDVSAGVEYAVNPAMLVLPADEPVHLCAANAASNDVRLIIASRGFKIAGVVTGLDFCRLAI